MEKDKQLHTTEDNYNVFVPLDLEKSIDVDENGDYIVQGVMTSDAKDEEGDTITPDGMDCSYFIDKGWIKYEHGNKPDQFIGEPLEVKVGQFKHPKTEKSVNGIFVKGRLFASRDLTQQAVKALNDLKKSNTKRTMGWSIEGNVKERCRKTGKIVKSVLRNVVLTMNPINTVTWAELAKSFAKDHELTVITDEPMDKAMDIAGAQAIATQSLEGFTPKKEKNDNQEEWVKAFREFCRNAVINKSFRNKFVTSGDEAELLAFDFALRKGLDYEEADEFASYIAEKHTILKSMVNSIGGETMSEEVKNTLSSLLDEDLEELQKSLDMDDSSDEHNEEDFESEDEELEKSFDEDEDGEDEDDLEKSYDEDEDEEDDSEEDEDGEEDEEDEETEKSFGNTDFAKSFGADESNSKAMEVSDFLTNLVDEVGYHMDGFEKSMGSVRKQNTTLTKAMTSMGKLMKGMAEKIEDLSAQNEDLQKSLSEVMNRPIGRKSVVNNREVQTLSKSMGDGDKPRLSKAQIGDELMKSFEAGELNGSEISRYEAGVPLDRLNLPDTLRQKLGM